MLCLMNKISWLSKNNSSKHGKLIHFRFVPRGFFFFFKHVWVVQLVSYGTLNEI